MKNLEMSHQTNDEKSTNAEATTPSQHCGNALLPAVLRLTVTKKWFNMIASGEKNEEYREIKAHWIQRLISKNGLKSEGYNERDLVPITLDFLKDFPQNVNQICKDFRFVEFKNGYAKNCPTMMVYFKGLEVGKAKPEWSDNWQGDVFVIKLGNIVLQ